jgi:CIC family chloride channel protein
MKILIEKLYLPPDIHLMGTATLVGILTGIGAIAFRYLINGVQWLGYDLFPRLTANWGSAYVIIVPALGGLMVGPMIYFFAREAKGHGVPEVMEAVALRGGRIRPIVAVIKSLASSISIGSGGSVGREGPIVQIGSAIGSTLGQRLKLSDERIRNLVACGAAGGIAATFNAPIAGVIFALEIILGQFTVRHFSSVVISSVAASVIGRAVFGDIPAFRIPLEYGVKSLWEFGFYIILGILAALLGVTFVRVLYWSEDVFTNWKSIPEWFQPVVGGVLLGATALAYPLLTGVTWEGIPQVYNVGYEVIEAALSSQLTLKLVLVLLVLKLIATSLTLGSGGSGGVFAPSLFMGAMLGAGFEMAIKQVAPEIIAPAGAYALVGMGALFAASAHAPITAVLIMFELTGDYRIILPLMVAVVVATIFAQWILKGESIYTLKLSRRGIRLQRGLVIDVMQGVHVREVMSHDLNTIQESKSAKHLSRVFNQTKSHGLIVLNGHGKLWGIVTISDLDRAADKGLITDEVKVKDIATPKHKMAFTFPDETINQALNRMAPRGLGRLPVISHEDPDQLLGIIRRVDIVRAYHLALTRMSEIENASRHIELDEIGGEVLHLFIKEGVPAIGKTVQEIADLLPKESVLVSIMRGEKVLFPHGDTVFELGDEVIAFVRNDQVEKLLHCFQAETPI